MPNCLTESIHCLCQVACLEQVLSCRRQVPRHRQQPRESLLAHSILSPRWRERQAVYALAPRLRWLHRPFRGRQREIDRRPADRTLSLCVLAGWRRLRRRSVGADMAGLSSAHRSSRRPRESWRREECPFRKFHLDSLAHSTVRDDVEQWGRQGKGIELMTEDRRRCRRVASSFRTRLVSISQAYLEYAPEWQAYPCHGARPPPRWP